VTSTTFPHLPFEDNSFDLIYAGSVFTHISDLEDTWLMELRRITRPRGYLYITIHDNHTINLLLSSPPGHWLHDTQIRRELLAFEKQYRFLENGFCMFFTSREPGNSQVYHDRGYIREAWGRYFEIVSFTAEAYGYQTAVTLRK
jgi:ubiquinone/menaquinone biosynthesis C-methylase UbiE